MSEAYDVFISYHARDHVPVERIARLLQDRFGIRPFLDRWYLVPGQPWREKLEAIILNCQAVAVCIGPHDMGPWQQREVYLAQERQGRTPGFPLIPALLPGAEPVLGFLGENTWVDFRTGFEDELSLSILAGAIRGKSPGPDALARIQETAATVCPFRGLLYFREEDALLLRPRRRSSPIVQGFGPGTRGGPGGRIGQRQVFRGPSRPDAGPAPRP